jgi:hypothetical protein
MMARPSGEERREARRRFAFLAQAGIQPRGGLGGILGNLFQRPPAAREGIVDINRIDPSALPPQRQLDGATGGGFTPVFRLGPPAAPNLPEQAADPEQVIRKGLRSGPFGLFKEVGQAGMEFLEVGPEAARSGLEGVPVIEDIFEGAVMAEEAGKRLVPTGIDIVKETLGGGGRFVNIRTPDFSDFSVDTQVAIEESARRSAKSRAAFADWVKGDATYEDSFEIILENSRGRSILAQVLQGILFDPTILWGTGIGTQLLRNTLKAATRVLGRKVAREALESVVKRGVASGGQLSSEGAVAVANALRGDLGKATDVISGIPEGLKGLRSASTGSEVLQMTADLRRATSVLPADNAVAKIVRTADDLDVAQLAAEERLLAPRFTDAEMDAAIANLPPNDRLGLNLSPEMRAAIKARREQAALGERAFRLNPDIIVAQDVVEESLLRGAGTTGPGPTGPQQLLLEGTKVVDSTGTPRRVFHGSPSIFEEFNPTSGDPNALFGPGVYFTDDPSVANGYAKTVHRPGRETPNVRPVFLKLTDVLDMDAPVDPWMKRAVNNPRTDNAPGNGFFAEDVVTNEDAYNFLKHDFSIHTDTLPGFGDAKVRLNDFIAENFDGITHIGGGRSGTAPHRVWIALGNNDPKSFFSIKNQVIPALGGPRISRVGETAATDSPGLRMAREQATEALGPPPEPPIRKLGEAYGNGEPPARGSHDAFDDLYNPSWETHSQFALRKIFGARQVAQEEGVVFLEQGAKVWKRVFNKAPEELVFETDTKPLFEALHGDRPVSELSAIEVPSLQRGALGDAYSEIDELRRLEERDSFRFNEKLMNEADRPAAAFDARNFSERMMAHPDYFPRGWTQESINAVNVKAGRGFGSVPGFKKPRVDASFPEMLEAGYVPASADPYRMMAMRRIAGIEYREQIEMINFLTSRGKVIAETERVVGVHDNWRVPQIGPVFTGRPFLKAGNEIGTTPRLLVEKSVADVMEGLYGGKSSITGLSTLSDWSSKFRRLAFQGAVFQHIDMATRGAGSMFTISGLKRGAPLRFPAYVTQMVETGLNPRARKNLRRELFSDKPLGMHNGKPVTGRMVQEQGLALARDPAFIRELGLELPPEVTKGVPRKTLESVGKFFENSLSSAYMVAQKSGLENWAIPAASRKLGKGASAEQVAALAAENVNLFFSTPAPWQTVMTDPTFKAVLNVGLLSANETESLIRSTLRAFGINVRRAKDAGGLTGGVKVGPLYIMRSPHQAAFVEQWAGMFVWLTLLANGINYWATGKPLPWASYNPITTHDPYGPFKVGYSSRFLSPQAPYLESRNGGPVYIDLVGQMDTAFRWALNPVSALASRGNIVPRAIYNNIIARQTFFGENIQQEEETTGGNIGRTAINVGLDVFPIGPRQLTDVARIHSEKAARFFPANEPRLGAASGFQMSGVNLRSESTAELKVRAANELGMTREDSPEFANQTITDSRQISPSQTVIIEADERFGPELLQRNEDSLLRDNPFAVSNEQRANKLATRMTEEEALVAEFNIPAAGTIDPVFNARLFRSRLSDIQKRYITALKTLDEALPIFNEQELPIEDGPRALVQYYKLFELATRKDGSVDFEYLDSLRLRMASGGIEGDEILEQGWTEFQLGYIETNTGLSEHAAGVNQFYAERDQLESYFALQDQVIDRWGVREDFKEWQGASDAGRDALVRGNRFLRNATTELGKLEALFERNNPDVARILVRWQYRERVFNRDVQRQVRDAVHDLR